MSEKGNFFQYLSFVRIKLAVENASKLRANLCSTRPPAQRGFFVPLFLVLLAILALFAVYGVVVWKWSYSTGERVGVVQKISNKGWLCKTWEGELNMVILPGGIPEKFYFTVWNEETARRINKTIGKRVSLHYEEKIGLPTSCFGDTRHYITRVDLLE
jgi:hypothetical protein